MKYILCSLLLSVMAILIIPACSDQLDTKVENNFGDDITWQLPDYALGVLYNAYENIPQQPNSFGNDFLDVATDNALSEDKSSKLSQYVMGGVSAVNNPFDSWKMAYTQFNNIHLFMRKALNGSVIFSLSDSIRNVQIKKRLWGECYFLRAWWGMELLQRYGGLTAQGQALGYPIVRKDYAEADISAALHLQRDSYEDCVKQILADCDSAFKYLPLVYKGSDEDLGVKQDGRASGRAALALQSRAALFGASPAYQPTATYAISPDSIQKKWLRAAILAANALDKGNLGPYRPLVEAMYVGAAVQGSTDDEFLFRTWFNNNSMEKANFPPLFWGTGRTNPSQNLIDAYTMKSGFPIFDSRSGYNPQNPYSNRDNRFEHTIYYNGKMFNSDRPLEIYTSSNGIKGRDVAGYDYNNTVTGYYLKKFMSSKKDMLYNPNNQGQSNDYHQYPLLRRAEVYLNLAEALNEVVGPKGSIAGITFTAYDIIKDIRSKNGISSVVYLDEMAGTKDDFRKMIQNERRLEMAFENQRFYDLRRWLLPLNESIRGVKVTKTSSGLVYEGTDPTQQGLVVETRKLDGPQYYYNPIPYAEIAKNPELIQNKGW